MTAAEPGASSLATLIRLLEPSPGRLEFAVRVALICALTALVVEYYQTPDPALAIYVVFFLNRRDRVTSLIMNIVMVVLISIVIGLVLLVAMVVIDDAMWRTISIAAISCGLLFLASASKLRPVGATLALIVGYALDLLGLVQLGEEATRGLLYAWLFVGIPVGVSIVVNLLLAPAPLRLAERDIARRLALAAALLRAPDATVRRRFRAVAREGVVGIEGWFKRAGLERTAPAADIAALRQAAQSTVSLIGAVDVLDRNPEVTLPAPLRAGLARTLDEMAAILRSGGYPLEIAWRAPDVSAPLAKRALADIEDALIRFSEPSAADVPGSEPPKEHSGFFERDAFTNPAHVRYALKTTAAAMFCYILYSLLDWPGIHTCFITCYIVSLGTAAETVEKLTLRILGCIVGAAAGIATLLFLVPSLASIGALMAVVFLGALVSAYIAAGSPRISYAGFQIAFAFFLCVVQGAAPSFDMATARDRVVGILLGNLVVFLVFTRVWPVSVSIRIDPAIASLLRRLGAMSRAASRRMRRAASSEAQAALGAIEADLDLVRYEPASVRPDPGWLAARQGAAREIGALEALLLVSAEPDTAHVADRLEALATRLESPGAPLVPPVEGPPTAPVQAIIATHIARLEAALSGATEGGAHASA